MNITGFTERIDSDGSFSTSTSTGKEVLIKVAKPGGQVRNHIYRLWIEGKNLGLYNYDNLFVKLNEIRDE